MIDGSLGNRYARRHEHKLRLTGPVLVPPKIHSSGELDSNGASNRDPPHRMPFDRGQCDGVMGGNDGRVERR